MKLKHITVALLALITMSFSACETMDDQEVEYSPVWPISGEWQTHVADENGANVVTTSGSNPTGIITLRTYNTSDNVSDKVWVRLGTTQTYAIWGKATCDVSQRTISGQALPNDAKANNTFTIQEAKVFEQAVKVGSGLIADSIYLKYTSTAAPGKTYTVKGHRRTRTDGLE
ncbi:MAG: hypothetical protein K0S09_1174 [Sphingobacteriaceae bacterium]|jgi:hypothetical protein|nr:hypothetical protein [Sphingobacteriaceae bacterium]